MLRLSAATARSAILFACAHQDGTVFELSPPAGGSTQWTESVLFNFNGRNGDLPIGGLVVGKNGELYGTTFAGGAHDLGIVFELIPPHPGKKDWSEKILHAFTGGKDGANPIATLVVDTNGILYGTAMTGGVIDDSFNGCPYAPRGNPLGSASSLGCGTVFKLTPPAVASVKWTFKVIYKFTGGEDGSEPFGSVLLGNNGVIFGTTSGSGDGLEKGTVFQITQ